MVNVRRSIDRSEGLSAALDATQCGNRTSPLTTNDVLRWRWFPIDLILPSMFCSFGQWFQPLGSTRRFVPPSSFTLLIFHSEEACRLRRQTSTASRSTDWPTFDYESTRLDRSPCNNEQNTPDTPTYGALKGHRLRDTVCVFKLSRSFYIYSTSNFAAFFGSFQLCSCVFSPN